METYKNIDEYISVFPEDVKKKLEQVREVIKTAVPEAEEAIAYGIPTFKLNGNLVHFGGFKNHIGFYPTPRGLKEFEKELSEYKGAKGSVQFPLDNPLPLDLIKRITLYRVKASQNNTNKKAKAAVKQKFNI